MYSDAISVNPSPFRQPAPHFSLKLLAPIALVCGLFLTCRPVSAQSYAFPAPAAVGASASSATVTVSLRKSGLLSAIGVGGQGNAGLDFAAAGSGTCSVGVSYPAGQSCTVGVKFSPLYPGRRAGAVVLLAADGSALGTAFLSGMGLGGIATFSPGDMSSIAGQAEWLYNGDGIIAVDASIFLPFGIAIDPLNDIYIADQGNNRVRKVTASTGIISTIAGNGILGSAGDGGPATQASLSGPSSVAIDGAGNLYISDSGNNAIRRIDAGTGLISTIAGTPGKFGYTGDGALATSAKLNAPNGIALDAAGNLFIADSANSVIRRVDASTGIISTVAGTGTAAFNGDGIPATSAALNQPWSVTCSGGGVLYIADQGNNRIRMIDASGQISTVAGTGVGSFTGDTGPALQAALNAPASVVLDVAGNMYIADSGNNRVRKVAADTGVIQTIAGSATLAETGDYGPADKAGLYGPYTLALDGLGNLFIADVFHNRIREVIADVGVLFFQPMRIGRVSPAQQQIVENDGNAPLNILSLQALTNAMVDANSNTCIPQLALNPLETCLMGAAMSPTKLGTPVIGNVQLNTDAVNSPSTLELSGNVLNQDPTTITLSSNLNPSNAGDAVVFAVSVTSGGIMPTGAVTLYDGTNSLGVMVLQNGTGLLQVGTLTGGQHNMSAAYAGDSNNASGASATLLQVVKVATANTQTTLTSSSTLALAGMPITFTANVSVTASGSASGAVSGPVTFTDAGTIVGAGSVTNGVASVSITSLAVGSHSVVATFAGTSSFGGSASPALKLTVQPGATATALSSSSNPSLGGGSVVFTASVASDGVIPTGSVAFADGATPLGSAILDASGKARLTLTTLGLGTHSILASYPGDADNNGSTSSAMPQTVNMATTAAALSSSLNPAPQGSNVILTASVAGNGGIPTGAVQFTDGATILGSAKLNAAGSAVLSIATLGLGAHSIVASYQGDAVDGASISAALTQTVTPATSTVALTSSANPSAFAAPLVFSVQVQGTGSQPSGTVTLEDGATTLGVQTLDAKGNAGFSLANLAIGSHNLVAIYSGDANHTSNSAGLTQRIVQVTSTSLGSSAVNGIAGNSISWTATVTGLQNQPLTGTVAFKDGATAIATIPVAVNGTAGFSSSALAIGSHSLTAVYSGDTLDQASNSAALAQSIVIATTSVALSSSANPASAGASLTLTAQVSGNGATPTGTVTFKDGAAILGASTVAASGGASFALATLTPGVHTLTATYNGDTNDSTAVSAALSQEVEQQIAVAIASAANPSLLQQNVDITIAVTGNQPAYPATGTVTLLDGASAVGTATLNSVQTVTFTLVSPAVGAHTLTAVYSGDTRNGGASSAAFTQSVILRPTTVNFTSSATTLSAGQQVTFVAVIQGAGPQTPTGIVNFVAGSTVLGSAPLNASGVAVLAVDPPQGNDRVVAQYPGDSLFAASNSTPITVVIGPTVEFTLTATPATITVPSGGHTTLAVAMTSAATFADTLDLGCAGLPTFATCTFSQDQMKVSGGTAQTFTVVVDTGNPLGSGATVSQNRAASTSALACFLPGGALLALLLLRPRRFLKQFAGLALMLLAILVSAGGLTGCANSLNTKATPAGSYTFRIVGTGAVTGATQSGSVSLTVTN